MSISLCGVFRDTQLHKTFGSPKFFALVYSSLECQPSSMLGEIQWEDLQIIIRLEQASNNDRLFKSVPHLPP